MNSYEPFDLNVKNYKEPKNISKQALSNLKIENKNIISSERGRQNIQLTNNNNPINNQLAFYKKRRRYSVHKNPFMTTIDRGITLNKRSSLELPRTNTKNMIEKYNLQKEDSNKNNNKNNLLSLSKNSSNNQLEKSLKQTIIIMKNEIESKKKIFQEKMKIPESKFISNGNVLNNLDANQKLQARSRLSLPNIDTNFLKKNNSFEYNEKSHKKIIKRLKTEINFKFQNEDMFKRYSEVIESDDSEENSNIINSRNISFSPNSNYILFFDILIIIANLYSLIVIPLSIAKDKNILKKGSNAEEVFKYLNDIIYLFDFLISLVRGYYNYEMEIVRNNKKILIHYLKKDFFTDFIEAIPFYCLLRLFYRKDEIFYNYHSDTKTFLLKLFFILKSFKIFKIMAKKKNKALEDFYRFLSVYYYLEKVVMFIIYFIIFILFIHLFICLHIFFALQKYPNWFSFIKNHNESFYTTYIASFYFLMTTMTTVGYGDIVCISIYERIFHIILLGIGTIVYSFIVSKVGNYLRDQSYEQIKLSKDLNILESIRVSYPTMSFKLYYKIQNHLLNISKKRKKTGLSLLINGIPETIKNELLFKVYSKVINGFNIFKKVDNSHFILQMLTSFIPIISKKEEILILEGELIDNIIFVKDGRLSIEVTIDLNDPYMAIKHYLNNNFKGISRKEELKNNNTNNTNITIANSILAMRTKNYKDLKYEIDNLLLDNNNQKNTIIDDNGISVDLGRLDFSRDNLEINNNTESQQIKILDFRKNEHFGDIHMFLQKPSPFTLRIKSRIAEILLLRKHDAILISKTFPNIWRRIYSKSYHNLVSIKKLTIKTLKRYYNTNFYSRQSQIINLSKNDINGSRMSQKSSILELSKIIRKTKTNKTNRINAIMNSNKNNDKMFSSLKNNKIDLPKSKLIFEKSIKKNSDEINNNELNITNISKISYKSPIKNEIPGKPIISISLCKALEKSPKEKIENNNQLTSYKFTFQRNSFACVNNNSSKQVSKTGNSTICEDKENFEDINEKTQSEINKKESINECDEKTENSTEKISSNSNDKNSFLILEDIDGIFAKKIKKKIKKRNKIDKIKSLFELQKKVYQNNLIKLYTQIYNNNQLLNRNQNEISINLYNNISNQLFNISYPNSNTSTFSKIITSEEDDSNIITRPSDTNPKILKPVLSESFEIKSSYPNFNILSKGEIIKNTHYQKILEVLIKNYLNHEVDEESLKILVEGIPNTKNENKITNKSKYKKCQTKNFQNKKRNLSIESEILSPINSKDIKESKISLNKKKNANMKRTKTKRNVPNNNDKAKKVKFEKIEFFNGKEKKEIQTEIKKRNNDTEIKKIKKIANNNNTDIKKLKHSKTRMDQKRVKLKKVQTKKEKKEDNIEGQVILTSSMNAINETENDKNLKNNKLVLLNKVNNKNTSEQETNKDSLDKSNKKCIIF